jgi:DNA-binding transcriptional LysR family regulator
MLAYRLPQVLRIFHRRFPHVELIFRPQFDEVLPVMLESGKLDMAVCMIEASPNPTIKSIPLRTERIFLLAHPSHPLAARRTVKASDLAGQSLLLTENGCGYRLRLDRQLAMQNVRPGNVTEFSSVEAIKQCVLAGMGLGLLPAIVVARELRQHQLRALHWSGTPLDIDTYILWHKDKWISPAMAAFMQLVQEKLEEAETDEPVLTLAGALAR